MQKLDYYQLKSIPTKQIKICEEEDDIELYNNRFVTNSFVNKETDVIYKLRNKDIFFIIEHQSTVDYNMAMRIVEYKTEIIRQYKKRENNKNVKIPLVNAIVINTSNKKWDGAKSLSEIQVKYGKIENNSYDSFKLIDTNNYSEEEMLKEEGALLKIALLDKSKSKEELVERYEKICKIDLPKEEENSIKEYMMNATKRILTKEEIIKIVEKDEEGEKGMLEEMLWNEMMENRKMGKQEGKKLGLIEGRKEGAEKNKIMITKALLRENIELEKIKRWTKMTKKEIMKLKEEIEKDNKNN